MPSFLDELMGRASQIGRAIGPRTRGLPNVSLDSSFPGLLVPGNIPNLYNRPSVAMGYGPPGRQEGWGTTYSMNFEDNQGRQVLVPTIVNGKRLTDDEAIQRYYQTGQHLGIFDNPTNADAPSDCIRVRRPWATSTERRCR